ncbi:MAG: zinc-ribbon domain-containing protein, partial [Paludibacteraceae bacterium]|nr:zinc-ribbon domain-containing protein [Paludibacteraceae bacterium]
MGAPQIAERLAVICCFAEWDYIKNDSLTAYQVYPKSTKKVWWKCQKCGHEWQAVIASRAKGTKCPLCSGHIVPGK